MLIFLLLKNWPTAKVKLIPINTESNRLLLKHNQSMLMGLGNVNHVGGDASNKSTFQVGQINIKHNVFSKKQIDDISTKDKKKGT